MVGGFVVVSRSFLSSSDSCKVSFGTYKGHQYTTTSTVGKPICWIESKWMRVQQHAVKFENSASIIRDWLWIDYHDRINVLVEAPSQTRKERLFWVFEQSKYALEGRTSKAIIGGIMEPGEVAVDAAKREVLEEMHVECEEMHLLGRFRTDVNRGMGWVHGFLAAHCKKTNKRTKEEGEEVVGEADVERQDLKTLTLTELRDAARNGDFLEVQWSNTVSLALLHPELMGKRDCYN